MTQVQVNAIIQQMFANDRYCQGAIQQVANGSYRAVELLVLLNKELDTENAYGARINSIEQLWNTNERYCQGAPQQAANGMYRIVELLQILMELVDQEKTYTGVAANIITTLNTNERYCQSAPQQLSNGSYRVAEMLKTLATLYVPERSGDLDHILSEMFRINNLCQGAPQQTANGMDSCALIMEILVTKLDEKGLYAQNLRNIVSLKVRNNSLCQGADQQSANYIYRIMEMVQIITQLMDDKKKARIEQYWQEHAEEKAALLEEKAQLNLQIQQIEAEANALNANEELTPVRVEKSALEKELNACGVQELQQAQQKVDAAKAARAAIGFFQFSAKKEAKAVIEHALEEQWQVQEKVKKEKAAIQQKINAKQKEIDRINQDLEHRRNVVRMQANPAKHRIEAIDAELTRQR